MKIRKGFVSNSSSSSFIVATKNDKQKEFLDKYTNSLYSGSLNPLIVKEYIEDCSRYDDKDEYFIKTLLQYEELKNKMFYLGVDQEFGEATKIVLEAVNIEILKELD